MNDDMTAQVAVPVVVAEVSANHRGTLESALSIIEAVADSGATHVKFQTYTPDTMTIDHDGPMFRISSGHDLWADRSLYSLYEQAQTPWEWHPTLFQHSRDLGLIPFSSPFDTTSVDFLESLEPQLYKVASMEVGDINLIRYIASKERPMVISTGASTLEEIDKAVAAALKSGCPSLTLLLCTSSYPAAPQDSHLARMETLRSRYGLPVGLSDHTVGISVAIAAAALGACMIEKHVTLRRSDGGPDAAFSIEPEELSQLVVGVNQASRAVGLAHWHEISSETESRRLKRSLYVVKDCKAGETVTHTNVRSIRPSGGMDPALLEEVLGEPFSQDVKRGTPLSYELLSRS